MSGQKVDFLHGNILVFAYFATKFFYRGTNIVSHSSRSGVQDDRVKQFSERFIPKLCNFCLQS